MWHLYGLKAGVRVTLRKDVDLHPHGIVHAGATGVVVEADCDFIDIKLDDPHPGLWMYDNTMWLCPSYDDVPSYIALDLTDEGGKQEAA